MAGERSPGPELSEASDPEEATEEVGEVRYYVPPTEGREDEPMEAPAEIMPPTLDVDCPDGHDGGHPG